MLRKSFAECRWVVRKWWQELDAKFGAENFTATKLRKNPHAGGLTILLADVYHDANWDWGDDCAAVCRNPDPVAVKWMRDTENLCWEAMHANPDPWVLECLQERWRAKFGRYQSEDLWQELCKNSNDWAVHNLIGPIASYWMRLDPPNLGPALQDWQDFSDNPNIQLVAWLIEHPTRIYWDSFSRNAADMAVQYMLQTVNQHRIDWSEFNRNPNPIAVEYLRTHPQRIVWGKLCENANPTALQMVADNWYGFDSNVWSTVSLDKVALNPAIFVDEYEEIARDYFRDKIAAELMAVVWHPRNIYRFKEWGEEIDADL